jgi:hypothetical protein
VGNPSSAPLANGAIVSGTAVVYFVSDTATVTLPVATTAGQQLVLLDPAVNGLGFTIKANNSDTINDVVFGLATSLGGSVGPSWSVSLISDGLNHWYVLYRN